MQTDNMLRSGMPGFTLLPISVRILYHILLFLSIRKTNISSYSFQIHFKRKNTPDSSRGQMDRKPFSFCFTNIKFPIYIVYENRNYYLQAIKKNPSKLKTGLESILFPQTGHNSHSHYLLLPFEKAKGYSDTNDSKYHHNNHRNKRVFDRKS